MLMTPNHQCQSIFQQIGGNVLSVLTKLKERISGKVPSGKERSNLWANVREGHLFANPTCGVCGGKEKLEVHHIVPFHISPSLELDPKNLITLCESKKHGVNCHLFIGHLGNYRNWNSRVRIDALYWLEKIKPQKLGP